MVAQSGDMRRWQMMELDPETVSSEALLSSAARADALVKLQLSSSRQATRSLSLHNKTTITVGYVQLRCEMSASILSSTTVWKLKAATVSPDLSTGQYDR